MPLCLTTTIEDLAARATGRSEPLFQADIERHRETLAQRIGGKRILVAGGAGSIGSACIRELLQFAPASITVLDPSENNAVELLRWVRSGLGDETSDIAIEPLDYGSPLAATWLAQQPTFDLVLAFAALKHVRSERDVFSLLRMCEVNILGADRFCTALRQHGHGADGVFFVSTDKAAKPTSLMGASKRLMEAVCWFHSSSQTASLLHGGAAAPLTRMTSTRFANVAFSDGSLPWAYLQRLSKGQPLAGPVDVRRYLVCPKESGQLCLLASQIVPHHHIGIPVLDPEADTISFDEIARMVIESQGLQMAHYADDAAARAAVDRERAAGRYPFVGTHSDTSGEKVMEEFLGEGEQAHDCGCAAVHAVGGLPYDGDALAALVQRLAAYTDGTTPLPNKAGLVADFACLVRDIHHKETGMSLDRKM